MHSKCTIESEDLFRATRSLVSPLMRWSWRGYQSHQHLSRRGLQHGRAFRRRYQGQCLLEKGQLRDLLWLHAKQLTSTVVMNCGLGKHGVVFNFRLSEWWAVARDDDEFGLSLSESLQRWLVANLDLARLENKLELGVDWLCARLFWLCCWSHVSECWLWVC